MPMEHYTGPLVFDRHIKHIVDEARALRDQCDKAGVLNPRVIGQFDESDIDVAMLMLAIERTPGDVKAQRAARAIRKHMVNHW